jgi:RNA polymerase sigma-70 factor (ECF subfamily)
VNDEECSRALATLETLYDEHGEAVYRYALGMLGSREDAEDVVQTIWLRMARKPERLFQVRDLGAYVWTAARNQVKSVYRKRGRDSLVDRDPKALDTLPAKENPGFGPDDLRDMERAVASLSRKQREAIVLVGLEGLTLEETAECLGIPRGTVASRYRAGVEKMKRFLGRKVST